MPTCKMTEVSMSGVIDCARATSYVYRKVKPDHYTSRSPVPQHHLEILRPPVPLRPYCRHKERLSFASVVVNEKGQIYVLLADCGASLLESSCRLRPRTRNSTAATSETKHHPTSCQTACLKPHRRMHWSSSKSDQLSPFGVRGGLRNQ